MAKEALITHSYLLSILHYEPLTGIFTWLWRDDASVQWNGRYAGKNAGYINKHGHLSISINCVGYYSHRLAWFYITGKWPRKDIDHKNTIKTDNRFCNLRLATKLENDCNRQANKNNKSGYKGVHFCKFYKKWKAQIGVNRRKISLGYFRCPTAAYLSYCRAAKKHHGEFARVA